MWLLSSVIIKSSNWKPPMMLPIQINMILISFLNLPTIQRERLLMNWVWKIMNGFTKTIFLTLVKISMRTMRTLNGNIGTMQLIQEYLLYIANNYTYLKNRSQQVFHKFFQVLFFLTFATYLIYESGSGWKRIFW